MSKVIINVKDTDKLEVLIQFLDSIDYLEIIDIELPNHHKFLITLKAACELKGGELIPAREVMEKLSRNVLASRDGNSKNNFVSFAKNFLKFIFVKESNIPSEPENILKVLPKEARKLLDYIFYNNFIALSSFEHALKVKLSKKPDSWAVKTSDVLNFIEEKVNDEGHDIEDVISNRPPISRDDLIEWFKEESKDYW